LTSRRFGSFSDVFMMSANAGKTASNLRVDGERLQPLISSAIGCAHARVGKD
jgi:hypothetical protein